MITFDNVSYRYANTDHDAVRNISFTVKPGELKIVTGASGCGKTTLMRLTNGLAPQVYGGTVTGSVTVAGKNVSQTPVAELAEDIGTLFQDPEEQFFALNVGNEIAFALRSRGVPADAITERVDAAARRVGIESLVKQDIHALSEGQKQKVGLADILALGPKVLILDEPTATRVAQFSWWTTASTGSGMPPMPLSSCKRAKSGKRGPTPFSATPCSEAVSGYVRTWWKTCA